MTLELGNVSVSLTNGCTLPFRICSWYATTLRGSSVIWVTGAGGTGAAAAAAVPAGVGAVEEWGAPLPECS